MAIYRNRVFAPALLRRAPQVLGWFGPGLLPGGGPQSRTPRKSPRAGHAEAMLNPILLRTEGYVANKNDMGELFLTSGLFNPVHARIRS